MTLVMTYVFWAALVAGISALPFLIAGLLTGRFAANLGLFVVMAAVFFVLRLLFFYAFMPGSSEPFYGVLGSLLVFTIISFGMTAWSYEGRGFGLFVLGLVMPIGVFAFVFGTWLLNESVFWNDHRYASLLGKADEKVWTTDIQPLDTSRMLLVPREAAVFNARKRVGELSTLGSQFVLEEENFSLQKIDGRLQHVAPLDFSGFFTWLNTSGVPSFMIIDGHDPKLLAKVERIKESKKYFRYTPGAWWTDQLYRHLRLSGLTREKFLDYHMELDDDKQPWWVVTLGIPTIWSNGDVVTGVAVVDPASGEYKTYALKDVPTWIDRVIPESIVENYLRWNGWYSRGWKNAFFAKEGTYEPEKVVPQFTQDGRFTYVTGTTSVSMKDDSLISLMYTDTRTGKNTRYLMKGGATVTSITELIDTHPAPDMRRAHAGAVHYINVFGVETAMAPLLVNDLGAYYGIAFVPIMNPDAEKVVRHPDVKEAYKLYIASLANGGVKIEVPVTEKLVAVRGKVERVTAPYEDFIGIMVKDVKPIIYGSVTEFPTLRFTQAGDDVEVTYVDSTSDTTALRKFHNFSLPQRGGMIPMNLELR